MPILALTKKELEERPSTTRGLHQEYVDFLTSARLGSGGKLIVKDEGVSRQSVKNRLTKAAAGTGKNITFLRSDTETVVFRVVE